jgi:hypothetical protein
MSEQCDVCGFEWDAITSEEIPARLEAAASGFAEVLRPGDESLSQRLEPGVWSVVEYGCHVRDAMLNLRDRIIVGLAEDNPTPKAMFTDVRIAAGLYAGELPERLAGEIEVAAGLLGRTVAALEAPELARPIFYGWPRATTRSLLWVAAQALHEAEHHLTDVRRTKV